MRGDYHKGVESIKGHAYPTTEDRALARFLKERASDYLKETINKKELNEAVQLWVKWFEEDKKHDH